MDGIGGLFIKNVAVTGFPFYLKNRVTGSPVTTGSVVIYITIDGGTQTTVAGDGTAVHEGNGQWSVNLTQAEMNGDVIGLLITHSQAESIHKVIHTLDIETLFTTALTEDYPPDTGDADARQILYAILQRMVEISYAGTTGTARKRDKTTTAFTVTIDSASNPTQITGYNKL